MNLLEKVPSSIKMNGVYRVEGGILSTKEPIDFIEGRTESGLFILVHEPTNVRVFASDRGNLLSEMKEEIAFLIRADKQSLGLSAKAKDKARALQLYFSFSIDESYTPEM